MTTVWNTDLLESVCENFYVHFVMKEFPISKQFTVWGINLEQWTLISQETKLKRRVLTEEMLDDIGARLEHKLRKSMKRLAQETGVAKSSARTAKKLPKFRRYKNSNPRILCSHAIQLAGFIFVIGFYSLSSKVRSIRS
jgi:hypothetical protein